MLFATIGALWVISFICMMFLGVYTYRLTKKHLLEETSSYFWTVSRVITLLFIGLSVFYFGVARQIEALPSLIAYQLLVDDIPLWSAYEWVSLSLLFGLLGGLVGVLDTLWNDWQVLTKPQVRWMDLNLSKLTLKVPYALSTGAMAGSGLSTGVLPGNVVGHVEAVAPQFASHDRLWALANALLGLFTGCFLFVGLQTVSQLNLVQALGVGAESSFVLEAGQRVRPTATPALAINLENLLTLESDNSSGQDRSADVPNGTENSITQNSISGEAAAFNPVIADAVEREAALGPTVAGPTVADTDQSDLAALAPASRSALNSVNGEQPPEVNNAQPALAEAPAAPEIAQTNEVVSIQEPYGVNARSGPDTSYNVITVLERGLTLAVLGRSDDGQWIQVQLPGQAVGWVASWVVVVGTR